MSDKKLNLAIVFGGVSSEHEVSRMSATSILNNYSKEKYIPYIIGITKDGRWLLYEGDIDKIVDGSWENDKVTPAFFSPDKSMKSLIIVRGEKAERVPIDVIFPVLHGKNGEDGTIQGLFEMSGIPYVGCDTFSSAVCMDKAVTHSLLSAANIEQTHYLWFYADRYFANPEKTKNRIAARLNFPVFVKPANAGSSVGVSKVNSAEELDEAVRKAAKEDKKILVEDGVTGKEVECAVLGNRQTAEASIVGEIGASAEFYDYDDKYINGTSEQIIPATIDDETAERIREIAVRAFRLLGCSGLARVDFFVDEQKKIILNEVNTMPGFTHISMYPMLWEAMGVSYTELIDRLVACAVEDN